MITGTCHFVSLDAAIKYYSNQGINRDEVISKWKKMEILIGPPIAKAGQKILIKKEEGRYFIEEWLDGD